MGYYPNIYNRFRLDASHRMTDTELAAFEAARAAEEPVYTPYTGSVSSVSGGRLPLRIPFRTKTAAQCRAIAKQYGARFDPSTKEWYLPDMGGTTVERDAIAALNRFRLVAPAAGAVPRSIPQSGSHPANRASHRMKPMSSTPRSGFVTSHDGFCVEFPNGWMISVICDNPNQGAAKNTQDTMECAIWTGTEWQVFQSTGNPVRTVTPVEFASVLAYVAAQPAGVAVVTAGAAVASPLQR